MAGPTTEVLNDDLKALRDDPHKVHVELKDEVSGLRADVSEDFRRIDASLAELRTLIKDEANGLRAELTKEIHRVDASVAHLEIQIKDASNGMQADLTKEIHRVDISLAELKTQVTFSTRVAIWGITLLTGSVLSGLFGGIWWASKMTQKVDTLELRFDKLESTMAKILEQTKPK